MTHVRRFLLLATAATVVALAGCAGSEGDDGAGGDRTQVTYLTAFNAFGREAYAWVAQEKGYFEEAGLDVDIQIGSGSGENMAALASGAADFAPVDSTGYILTKGAGKVSGITAISSVQQRSMVGLMTLDGYGISTPKDLEGKKLGDQSGATTSILFDTYAKLAKIDADKVEIIETDAGSLAGALSTRQVDAIGQFVMGRPLIEKAAGGKPAVALPFSDVMPDLYGNFLLTTDQIANENPDLAKKFTTALLRGLDYAIANPAEAGQILNQAQPETDAAVATQELEIMAPYTRGDASTLGAIDPERVTKAITILEDAGEIPAGRQPAEFVALDLVPKT